jgi:bifunctional N-acetylglucosamine-1-phosphate-uridyltransferase/glucosamine-1-phosphate-acetyltransferase GlmU-like protein
MKLVIFGSGGMAKEVIGYMHGAHEILYIVADRPFANERYNALYHVLAKVGPLPHDVVALLAIADPAAKARIVAENPQVTWGGWIDPSADISPFARIGRGSIIAPHCVVAGDAEVGEFVFLNTHSAVGHDAKVGDYATLGPRAQVCGGARVAASAQLFDTYVLPGRDVRGATYPPGSVVR